MRQNIKYPKITVKHTAQNWRLSRQCPQVELKIFLERKDCEVAISLYFRWLLPEPETRSEGLWESLASFESPAQFKIFEQVGCLKRSMGICTARGIVKKKEVNWNLYQIDAGPQLSSDKFFMKQNCQQCWADVANVTSLGESLGKCNWTTLTICLVKTISFVSYQEQFFEATMRYWRVT